VKRLCKRYTLLHLRMGPQICRAAAVPGRVLVVDDDESIRLLIQRLLARSGFAVETASDGGVALDMLSKDGYDALVLDLMMPHVDGFTVLRQLIATNPDLVSRTIVATAYPRDVAKRQLDEVCKVLIKPFDTAELVDAVRECVEHAR
jgi:DNA-binding response OmpR family regulator